MSEERWGEYLRAKRVHIDMQQSFHRQHYSLAGRSAYNGEKPRGSLGVQWRVPRGPVFFDWAVGDPRLYHPLKHGGDGKLARNFDGADG